MTFQTGTKVVLTESANRSLIGTEGVVTTSFHEGSTRIRITKLPEAYTAGWFGIGEPLRASTQKFRQVSFPVTELRKGDKIRVTMTAPDGTERINTGTIDDLGDSYRSGPIRSKNRNALAFRSIEQGTSDYWDTQVIELLDRPKVAFDAGKYGTGTVVTIDAVEGTAVKVYAGTWTVVNGASATFYTDAELAALGTDRDAFTVVHAK